MFRRFRLMATVLALLAVGAGASAAAITATAKQGAGLGSTLVNRFFSELKHHNVAGLHRLLSPAFQIQRANGTRLTKAEYLQNLPNVIDYKLRHFRTTSTHGAVVVTYQARTDELVDGKKVESSFAPRLSAFSLGDRGWQLVAHGNFNPPG